MGNDINMWDDIEQLEESGFKKQANYLLEAYQLWFIQNHTSETNNQLKDLKFRATTEFLNFPFDFENYGIEI